MMEIQSVLEDASTILLQEPPIGQRRDVCTSLLVNGEQDVNVLFVSYNQQAATCVDQVANEDLGSIGVITVGGVSAEVDDESYLTDAVSTPSDLTGLGIKIGQFLSNWEPPVAICFDSLTSMLQYVDFQTAYEFLHAITGQIYAAGGRAHFHIDPSAHDSQDVAGISSLFDASVTLEQDDFTVRKRKLLS